tara:strand:- start:1355 stop:1504 length:150 start_codon:yes stop_codon:yes gene_type:complete
MSLVGNRIGNSEARHHMPEISAKFFKAKSARSILHMTVMLERLYLADDS